jgi:class 3 adenylate cyclase/pimeloyl-ACP methyl ester carboxylesterase
VVGEGDADLAYVPEFVSNLVYAWENPGWRSFYLRLARSFRLILFDKRGTGISDHAGQFATLETRMEDLHAVLDAAGSSRPVVFGGHDGAALATLFAASYPERTRSLVLFHASAKRESNQPDRRQRTLAELAELRESWGVQDWCDELLRDGCPSLADDDAHRRWFANWLRVGATPAVAYALNRAYFETDLTDVLPAVHVPTLLLYRSGFEPETMGVADLIPSARTMRVSGSDRFGVFLSHDIADEIEIFVAGEEAPSIPESVLATVLFSDLVESTEHAARIGDRAWRDLLSRHHAIVRRELGRYRGHERDTAGDGFFATFDGPARAIGAAQAIIDGVGTLGLEMRIGIHVGECELHGDKIAGLAVNIGARIASSAQPGEVLVSQTVRDLVAGSGLTFEDRGTHELKGIPGTWALFATDRDHA